MSETEKTKRIEELLPSLSSIQAEYLSQGRALTEAEAEAIREQMRQDMAAGQMDARNDITEDSLLDQVSGGSGGAPHFTSCPVFTKKPIEPLILPMRPL